MLIGQTMLMREKSPVEEHSSWVTHQQQGLVKKKGSISLSTTEAKYIAVATCFTQILWMIKSLADLKVTYTDPIPLHCDNTSAISLSKNPVLHSKSKHIPIKYHFLREQVTNIIVQLNYIPSKEKTADIFTKPLAATPFGYLRQKLGVINSCVYLVRGSAY